MKNVLAFDYGTGGVKTVLYTEEGTELADCFYAYETIYPELSMHEQRPDDWMKAMAASTKKILETVPGAEKDICAISLSGHSCGAVPVDKDGTLLRAQVPIWSDGRAGVQARAFLNEVDETEWYLCTGGSDAPMYSAVKTMWYRDNEPEMFRKIDKILGTKDYINLKLTGRVCSDYSYAASSGVYDLKKWSFDEGYIKAAGLSRDIFPELISSSEVIGTLTDDMARTLGLSKETQVLAGGVDNSCMALGAKLVDQGQIYGNLGTSGWMAICADEPIVDPRYRTYVFPHIVPGKFATHTSIKACGASFQWAKNTLCKDLIARAEETGEDVYELMNKEAELIAAGSDRLLFNPSLSGGSGVDTTLNIRGSFFGLDLLHTRAHLIRAVLEGLAMNMRISLDVLKKNVKVPEEILIVGGGGRSPLLRQIISDCFEMDVIGTNIGQNAAALGAAAAAFVGTGMWKDYGKVRSLHRVESIYHPIAENMAVYRKMLPWAKQIVADSGALGDRMMA